MELAVPFVSAQSTDFVVTRSDMNGDGVVNILDVSLVAMHFVSQEPAVDVNGDGKIDILDVARVSRDFGTRSYGFDNLSNWSVVSGTWQITEGSFEGRSVSEGLIFTKNAMWENYTLTANVKIASNSPSAEAALCIRVRDSRNFYWAGLGCWGHRVSISRMVNGFAEELSFSGSSGETVKGSSYNVSVKVTGSTIMLYVNDILELTVNDSTLATGAVGMRTWNSQIIVDYISVISTASSQDPTHDFLYADGTKLRSSSGEEIILVGTQIDFNTLRRDIWFSLDDVKKMKSCGGVVLELHGLYVRFFMPQRGVVDQNWVDHLDKWVSWCEQQQMYYLISFGNFEYDRSILEIPEWFIEGKYAQPWRANDRSTINQASIDFWDIDNPLQEESRQAVLELFRFVANRYKNGKYALFGLVNEPFCTNHLVDSTNAEHLSIAYARFVERIVDVIRSTGAKQLIFVDKPYSSFYTSHFEPVNRDGIVWEDHLYVNDYSRDIDQWKPHLNEYVQRYVYTLNKPFFLGEYGPYPYSAYDSTLSDWRTILKEQVTFLKTLPVCGYQWHEWPYLEGEYYDYVYNYLANEDSEYILATIYG
jgi:hypothetical protein